MMVQRVGGFRRKSRNKLKRGVHVKGKISISGYLREFSAGERVTLLCNSAVQKGMYFPRFHGKIGTISKARGECYEVVIKDGEKNKTVHPIHLRAEKR